jgi:hypothetical protein
MSDYRNSQEFIVAGVIFHCWVTDDGQRYEWRSVCGRFRVGRRGYSKIERDDGTTELHTHHFAVVDGREIGARFASLRQAMLTAISKAGLRKAA